MGEIINSFSFQENHICWVQVDVGANQSILINKVVESPLPFIINYDNIQNPTTVLRIANQLKSLVESTDINIKNIRFLLSAKFGMVKKHFIDQNVPQVHFQEIVQNELNCIMGSETDEYFIYHPEYLGQQNDLKEVLTFSIRKELFSFIQKISNAANLTVNQINLNCFTIDELFRRFFPNIIGQTLLVNFTERGYEIVISNEKQFLDFYFKPYSKSLQSIDQLDEREIITVFKSLLDSFQHPGLIDEPIHSIAQVFLFGNCFKTDWLDALQNQCNLPVGILNPLDSSEWQISSDDDNFNSFGPYHFVEPLSNIF